MVRKRPAVEHFQRRRRDACGGDGGDGAGRVVDRFENAQQRRRHFRLAQQLHRDRGGDADGAFRAHEESRHVVATGLGRLAAELHDVAVGHHDFHAGHVIHRDAVHQGVRPAGIFGDVAADGAGLLAGRIGREVEAKMRNVLGELQIHHAGLHHGALVFDIDFEDAVHAREGDNDAALLRDRAAAQSGSRAASHDRNAGRRRHAHDLGNLLRILREDDSAGRALANARVVLVQHQVFGTVEDGVTSGNLAEVVDDSGQAHGETAPV